MRRKKLAGRKRHRFENPIETFDDLLKYVSREVGFESLYICDGEDEERPLALPSVWSDIETVAQRVTFEQQSETSFSYESDSISRTLQTLCLLRMPGGSDLSVDPRERFVRSSLLDTLLLDEDVEAELNRKHGKYEHKAHANMLRLGGLRCSKPVRIPRMGTVPPWQLGHILVRICRLYCGR